MCISYRIHFELTAMETTLSGGIVITRKINV